MLKSELSTPKQQIFFTALHFNLLLIVWSRDFFFFLFVFFIFFPYRSKSPKLRSASNKIATVWWFFLALVTWLLNSAYSTTSGVGEFHTGNFFFIPGFGERSGKLDFLSLPLCFAPALGFFPCIKQPKHKSKANLARCMDTDFLGEFLNFPGFALCQGSFGAPWWFFWCLQLYEEHLWSQGWFKLNFRKNFFPQQGMGTTLPGWDFGISLQEFDPNSDHSTTLWWFFFLPWSRIPVFLQSSGDVFVLPSPAREDFRRAVRDSLGCLEPGHFLHGGMDGAPLPCALKNHSKGFHFIFLYSISSLWIHLGCV